MNCKWARAIRQTEVFLPCDIHDKDAHITLGDRATHTTPWQIPYLMSEEQEQ
jgi:hypothetical protein